MKFMGISICALFCSLLIKDKNRAAAALLSIGGATLLILNALSGIKEIVSKIREFTAPFPTASAYLSLMLKVLAITLLTQFVSDICRDNGENALAGMTETAAKIVVITLVLPLFETVITIVGGLIK